MFIFDMGFDILWCRVFLCFLVHQGADAFPLLGFHPSEIVGDLALSMDDGSLTSSHIIGLLLQVFTVSSLLPNFSGILTTVVGLMSFPVLISEHLPLFQQCLLLLALLLMPPSSVTFRQIRVFCLLQMVVFGKGMICCGLYV